MVFSYIMIRKALIDDLKAVADIYGEIHSREEQGLTSIGWIRGIYPTEETARNAIECGELFVETVDGRVIGAAIINQKQVDVYSEGNWQYPAQDNEVMVLHTLVISPGAGGKGLAVSFSGSTRTMPSRTDADIFAWIRMSATAVHVQCIRASGTGKSGLSHLYSMASMG